ncbi:MAG TPA: butyrate kinase, partial [bacterium (Candidatus Stahlbacteria)]|nr:butyrate kinase [Candidatus Stahlbacteria bacterium]
MKILVINPGAGSTKLALFEDEQILVEKKITHSPNELARFDRVVDQLTMRQDIVEKEMEKMGVAVADLSAVVARGGPFAPLESGTYIVDETLVNDVLKGHVQADHASNLGVLIAYELTKSTIIPAYFVDPVSVDEFADLSRISGLPELPRKSLSHALNIKMVVRKAAEYLRKDFRKLTFIVAHLGSGISIAIHKKGRLIDVNNANDGGPLAPQRTGTLPVTGLIELC